MMIATQIDAHFHAVPGIKVVRAVLALGIFGRVHGLAYQAFVLFQGGNGVPGLFRLHAQLCADVPHQLVLG